MPTPKGMVELADGRIINAAGVVSAPVSDHADADNAGRVIGDGGAYQVEFATGRHCTLYNAAVTFGPPRASVDPRGDFIDKLVAAQLQLHPDAA
jgi:hypothetical protein